jgi:2-polyprenyl-3-methyl-5-hydroxy-6-metoxy-1,4-benzoquinol methylase
MSDSKKLWLSIDRKMRPDCLTLGRYTTQAYLQDPIRLSFITSRYKFCARLLSGMKTVIEIGCGDGFGGAIVAQTVQQLICTDVNPDLLQENRIRMSNFKNVTFEYHDFRQASFPQPAEAVYLIDTIEHIYPEEEDAFMTHLTASLTTHGTCLIGTPNETADQYANNWSRQGHVNLKGHDSLLNMGQRYFYNTFFFSMNDELVHTGFPSMAHFIWALCVGPKRR